jgi:peptidoglycan/LPS O-acetylase OafA/YrhL
VRRFPALDSVRGLAAVGVLTVHAVGVYARGAGDDAVRPWVERLDVAVPIFILLSGFLLYRPFAAAQLAGSPMPSLRAYAWRRALRILPGYWVALTVAAVVLGLPGVLTASGLPHYYGFLQSYERSTVAGGLPQAWTLCVDAAFYLLLPLVVVVVHRLGRGLGTQIAALLVLVAVSVAWKAWVLTAVVGERTIATEPWLIALPAFLDQFAVGMALAVASVRWEAGSGPPRWMARAPGAWWLAALGLFALSAWGAGLDHVTAAGFSHGQVVVRHALQLAIAVCVIMPAVVGEGRPVRLLSVRPLRRLGTISYGFYLYHLTVLGLLGRWGLASLEDVVPRYLLWFGAALLGTLVCAEVSWRLVEAPALRLKPPLWPRTRRAAAPTARAPRA